MGASFRGFRKNLIRSREKGDTSTRKKEATAGESGLGIEGR
jgi:hypothetical protein